MQSLCADYDARLATQTATSEEVRARQLAEQLASEAGKRVVHSLEQAVRRLGKRELSRGWLAWLEQWEAQARQRRLLAAAAARLVRPQLAAAAALWRRDWEAGLAEDCRLEGVRKAEAKGRELGDAHGAALARTEQRLQARML